jgi:MFS family permease
MEAGLAEAAAVDARSEAVSPARIFWATWTGWMLDAFDSAAYGLLLVSVWSDLLPRGGIEASKSNIAVYGGIGFSVFVLGWAFSIFWGWLADRIGRVRTMCITILLYSVFTALCGVVSGIVPFLVLRFLVGFGVGGEWAAGTPLLHESVPESVRVRLAGWLHTAAPVGAILASAAALLVVPVFGWRGMFLLGLSPALLAIYLRWQIPEPHRRSRPAGFSPLRSLFTGAQAVVTHGHHHTIHGRRISAADRSANRFFQRPGGKPRWTRWMPDHALAGESSCIPETPRGDAVCDRPYFQCRCLLLVS